MTDQICERLVDGQSHAKSALIPRRPNNAIVCRWLAQLYDVLRDRYACAREVQPTTFNGTLGRRRPSFSCRPTSNPTVRSQPVAFKFREASNRCHPLSLHNCNRAYVPCDTARRSRTTTIRSQELAIRSRATTAGFPDESSLAA
ncbi:hypothetical protein [Mesorhizobium sp. B264B2A]|uniref:terminase small subunit-like protein n=1 Tax=Mesorhizobium sp. B264B2A TaxID=2876666 RepID=UPI00398F104A